MDQNVTTCSDVCSLAPHSQAAIEAIPYSCVSEQNKSIPVQRQLSLTHTGLGKLNLNGVGLTSLINVWSQKAFSCYSILHLDYSAHCATPVPDWVGLFSNSSAAGRNGCLDLSCCSCP